MKEDWATVSTILFQQSVLSHVKTLAEKSGIPSDQIYLWEPTSLSGRPTVAIIWKQSDQKTVCAQHELTKNQERFWNTADDGSSLCVQVARRLIQLLEESLKELP
jgi:hypothetical protein